MESSPRVLILSPVPTHPPHEGNRERALQIVEAMECLGIRDQFFCHVRIPPIDCPNDHSEMARYWGSNYAVLETKWNSSSAQFRVSTRTLWMGRFAKALKRVGFPGKALTPLFSADAWFPVGLGRWLEDFAASWRPTIVVMEYPFLSKAFEYLPKGVWKVMDAQDVFTDRNKRLQISGITANWLSLGKAQETTLLRRADCIVAIQEEEAAFFKTITEPGRVVQVSALTKPVTIPSPSKAPRIVGLMGSGNAVNIAGAEWFIEKVLPRIIALCPGAHLTIAGSLAKHISITPGVELAGSITDRDAFYAGCRVIINPCGGGTGIKIKSLEALTYGRPLVTTPQGASGIMEGREACILIRESAGEFADACANFLNHPELADQFGRAGWQFMEQTREISLNALKKALRLAG